MGGSNRLFIHAKPWKRIDILHSLQRKVVRRRKEGRKEVKKRRKEATLKR